MTHRSLLVGTLSVLLAAPAWGDVLHLRDGTKVEGELRREGGFWYVTDDEGQVRQVGADRVQSIEITRPARLSEEQAQTRLASLRRSTEHLADIGQIIGRYERFIEQAEGTPAAIAARADLETWRERREGGMVRVGRDWVTTDQREQLRQEALQWVEEARLHVRQGRMREATPLIERALQTDPQNVSAIFLRGVMQYRQDQLPGARRSFEQANALLPEHGPTLNNLAVILWRQNQFIGALNYYDQAMRAAPLDRQVLDNVAEALEALPREHRNNIITQRVSRHFAEQDAQLQQQLSAEGLYRWGGTWVTREELSRLQEIEQQIRAELDVLARDFDAAQARIAAVDQRIETSFRTLRQLQAASFIRDAEGRVIRVTYPAIYYEIQRDMQLLESERAQLVGQLDALRQTAAQTEQRLPTPRYTGIQQLVGVEGVPVQLPASPAEPN